MTILNNVGLETASTFCFRLLSDLKSHLENVHDVDPSQMARGNDLFKRFKIRDSDGLLQHFTHPYPLMWDYWEDDEKSNKQSFLRLVKMVDNAHCFKCDEDSESFSSSFPNRAKKYWRKISAPYMNDQDDSDIVDEVGDQDVMPPPVLDKQDNIMSDFEKHMQEKNEELGNESASDDSTEEIIEVLSGGDDESAKEKEGQDGEEETDGEGEGEDEDSWIKSKSLESKLAKQEHVRDCQDSDDDNLFGSELEKQPGIPKIVIHQKRRIIESDDESSDLNNLPGDGRGGNYGDIGGSGWKQEEHSLRGVSGANETDDSSDLNDSQKQDNNEGYDSHRKSVAGNDNVKYEEEPLVYDRDAILNVRYSEKDEAKQLGAQFDWDRKKWTVPAGEDVRPFLKWNPAIEGRDTSTDKIALRVPFSEKEEVKNLVHGGIPGRGCGMSLQIQIFVHFPRGDSKVFGLNSTLINNFCAWMKYVLYHVNYY